MEGQQVAMRAPKSVMYGDQLPLGVEAKSQKRMFFPTTGDTYSPTSNTICRIDINYDGLLDTAQSFLEFDLHNKSTTTASGAENIRASFDVGQPVIRKLTISSGGVVLEEIHDYNCLVGGVLFPAQAGIQNLHYEGMNNNAFDQRSVFTAVTAADGRPGAPLATDGALNTAVLGGFTGSGGDETGAITTVKALGTTTVRDSIATAIAAGVNAGGQGAVNGADVLRYSAIDADSTAAVRTGAFATGASGANSIMKQQYKLVSGLMDNDKYLPLVLMNAGLTLEFELAPAVDCMVLADAGQTADYQITNVRYVAHLIDLERSFYDRLRMVQQSSGGVLQIAGQSWRGFRAT